MLQKSILGMNGEDNNLQKEIFIRFATSPLKQFCSCRSQFKKNKRKKLISQSTFVIN